MPRNKVSSRLKKIIIAKKKKKPFLSVRKLAELVRIKYKIEVSKSTVSNVLKEEKIESKKGRKKASGFYQKKIYSQAGLALILALDSQLGLFEYLSQQLKFYFPRLSNQKSLDKFIILGSFLSFLRWQPKQLRQNRDLLRLTGLRNFPLRKFKRFEQGILKQQPQLSLKGLKQGDLASVWAVKFFFKNGYQGFSDARLSTLWEGVCGLKEFSLSLKGSCSKVEKMLEDNLITIGYTKSFDSISLLAANFFRGAKSGLKRLDFLDKQGKIIKKITINDKPELNIMAGYYYPGVRKGMHFLAKAGAYKVFSWAGLGEHYASSCPVRAYTAGRKEPLYLDSILIKKKTFANPCWGILTNAGVKNKKQHISKFLKKYLYSWPGLENKFRQDMEIIEKSFFLTTKQGQYLKSLIPNRLSFERREDLCRVVQILAVIFKEFVCGWEPRNKQGLFTIRKNCIELSLFNVPQAVKENINGLGLYIGRKRLFVA